MIWKRFDGQDWLKLDKQAPFVFGSRSRFLGFRLAISFSLSRLLWWMPSIPSLIPFGNSPKIAFGLSSAATSRIARVCLLWIWISVLFSLFLGVFWFVLIGWRCRVHEGSSEDGDRIRGDGVRRLLRQAYLHPDQQHHRRFRLGTSDRHCQWILISFLGTRIRFCCLDLLCILLNCSFDLQRFNVWYFLKSLYFYNWWTGFFFYDELVLKRSSFLVLFFVFFGDHF